MAYPYLAIPNLTCNANAIPSCPELTQPHLTCDDKPSLTPFANEQIEVNDGDGVAPGQGPTLIVTRVSSDGFYVTDVDATRPSKAQGKLTYDVSLFTTPGDFILRVGWISRVDVGGGKAYVVLGIGEGTLIV